MELLDEFPIELYNQEDQHYNLEGEENQYTKSCLISWMTKKSTRVIHWGLKADCRVYQDSQRQTKSKTHKVAEQATGNFSTKKLGPKTTCTRSIS